MHLFVLGMLTMASALVSLFFLRYWRSSRDGLFAYFSAAFAIMTTEWAAVAALPSIQPSGYAVYLLRSLAFLLIIAGIIHKNRASRGPRRSGV